MKLCLRCAATFSGTGWRCTSCGGSPAEKDGFPAFAPELAADEGFKDAYFDELARLEAQNFWFRSRNRLIQWSLRRHFPGAQNFLEVGCGTGFVLAGVASAFPRLKLAGSEISSAGLAHAARRVPGAELFQMDARAIPFADEFDMLGAFDVLEHIHEDEAVLRQMHRAVRPGGGILLTVPQHDFLWSRMDEHACHVRRYAARDLAAKVRAAGFRVERITSFVSLLLPLMMASRRLQAAEDEGYDPLAELRIGGLANVLLEKMMSVERLVIRAGLNFPAGGSLFLVARKAS
ncbi:class I SAM-dependent methyltransferase [Polaromonas sp.]|uniref:class I SAM-dependent methyltransferase n=1 Tax=Polaromonas sp. TaxID=1869339 RepID=UPI002489D98B|nr:class I SAM-dependent methyltransferase [Polaromonas sp.]MDI1341195.1 methyltransferase domain-containing protein [Polaromonas sp.]